jgi:hypothetical protein
MRLALIGLAVTTAAVAVGGGSAANREGEPYFAALPGPGRVTYGENIAYRGTFTNIGGSTFTQVALRMRYPYTVLGAEPYTEAEPVDSTCPTTPTTVTLASGYHEWVCKFGQLKPGVSGTPQLAVAVVWKAPPALTTSNCVDCFRTKARWTIKDGVNDQNDPNDTFPFPADGSEIKATLLGAGETADEKLEAGGYELSPTATCDPLGQGSLRTRQAVSLDNKVSTTLCIPEFDNTPGTLVKPIDLGVATKIEESAASAGAWADHPYLGTASVCIADLGVNCAAEGNYVPFTFTFAKPVKVVFRISSDALLNGDKITRVFHAELGGTPTALPKCPAPPALSTNQNGCYTSINEIKQGKVKYYLVEAQAPGNGLWGW